MRRNESKDPLKPTRVVGVRLGREAGLREAEPGEPQAGSSSPSDALVEQRTRRRASQARCGTDRCRIQQPTLAARVGAARTVSESRRHPPAAIGGLRARRSNRHREAISWSPEARTRRSTDPSMGGGPSARLRLVRDDDDVCIGQPGHSFYVAVDLYRHRRAGSDTSRHRLQLASTTAIACPPRARRIPGRGHRDVRRPMRCCCSP